MQKIDAKHTEELLSYDARKEIIKNLGQQELLKIFDDYKPNYKPIARKHSPLDQQISIGISKAEKEQIAKEIKAIKRGGDNVSISSLVRSRAVGEIDIEAWRERAELGLTELNSIKWNKPALEAEKRKLQSEFDAIQDEDEESEIVISRKIERYEAMLAELSRPTIRRSSRMSGRVTFNEANLIRWRASRLTLTVADYMRYLIFGYLPFTENDRHLSVVARRRFYIAVIDISKNGWGSPPAMEECPNCARYAHENKVLREKLDRLRRLSN